MAALEQREYVSQMSFNPDQSAWIPPRSCGQRQRSKRYSQQIFNLEKAKITSAKASRKLGVLRRNIGDCNRTVRERSYRSTLKYVFAVWKPYKVEDKNRLDKYKEGEPESLCE